MSNMITGRPGAAGQAITSRGTNQHPTYVVVDPHSLVIECVWYFDFVIKPHSTRAVVHFAVCSSSASKSFWVVS